ncbi:hypothetical protein ALC53_00689 [Atta colombica]|uniref:Uncharacterized protein n=1 Tax=Atta colombica TaxID=520822 RepID=A0A195BVZ0_9HYME|nr:hypothetical protein ALC53_00689 [Atta colombica]
MQCNAAQERDTIVSIKVSGYPRNLGRPDAYAIRILCLPSFVSYERMQRRGCYIKLLSQVLHSPMSNDFLNVEIDPMRIVDDAAAAQVGALVEAQLSVADKRTTPPPPSLRGSTDRIRLEIYNIRRIRSRSKETGIKDPFPSLWSFFHNSVSKSLRLPSANHVCENRRVAKVFPFVGESTYELWHTNMPFSTSLTNGFEFTLFCGLLAKLQRAMLNVDAINVMRLVMRTPASNRDNERPFARGGRRSIQCAEDDDGHGTRPYRKAGRKRGPPANCPSLSSGVLNSTFRAPRHHRGGNSMPDAGARICSALEQSRVHRKKSLNVAKWGREATLMPFPRGMPGLLFSQMS